MESGSRRKGTIYVANVRNDKGTMGRHEIGTKPVNLCSAS